MGIDPSRHRSRALCLTQLVIGASATASANAATVAQARSALNATSQPVAASGVKADEQRSVANNGRSVSALDITQSTKQAQLSSDASAKKPVDSFRVNSAAAQAVAVKPVAHTPAASASAAALASANATAQRVLSSSSSSNSHQLSGASNASSGGSTVMARAEAQATSDGPSRKTTAAAAAAAKAAIVAGQSGSLLALPGARDVGGSLSHSPSGYNSDSGLSRGVTPPNGERRLRERAQPAQSSELVEDKKVTGWLNAKARMKRLTAMELGLHAYIHSDGGGADGVGSGDARQSLGGNGGDDSKERSIDLKKRLGFKKFADLSVSIQRVAGAPATTTAQPQSKVAAVPTGPGGVPQHLLHTNHTNLAAVGRSSSSNDGSISDAGSGDHNQPAGFLLLDPAVRQETLKDAREKRRQMVTDWKKKVTLRLSDAQASLGGANPSLRVLSEHSPNDMSKRGASKKQGKSGSGSSTSTTGSHRSPLTSPTASGWRPMWPADVANATAVAGASGTPPSVAAVLSPKSAAAAAQRFARLHAPSLEHIPEHEEVDRPADDGSADEELFTELGTPPPPPEDPRDNDSEHSRRRTTGTDGTEDVERRDDRNTDDGDDDEEFADGAAPPPPPPDDPELEAQILLDALREEQREPAMAKSGKSQASHAKVTAPRAAVDTRSQAVSSRVPPPPPPRMETGSLPKSTGSLPSNEAAPASTGSLSDDSSAKLDPSASLRPFVTSGVAPAWKPKSIYQLLTMDYDPAASTSTSYATSNPYASLASPGFDRPVPLPGLLGDLGRYGSVSSAPEVSIGGSGGNHSSLPASDHGRTNTADLIARIYNGENDAASPGPSDYLTDQAAYRLFHQGPKKKMGPEMRSPPVAFEAPFARSKRYVSVVQVFSAPPHDPYFPLNVMRASFVRSADSSCYLSVVSSDWSS